MIDNGKWDLLQRERDLAILREARDRGMQPLGYPPADAEGLRRYTAAYKTLIEGRMKGTISLDEIRFYFGQIAGPATAADNALWLAARALARIDDEIDALPAVRVKAMAGDSAPPGDVPPGVHRLALKPETWSGPPTLRAAPHRGPLHPNLTEAMAALCVPGARPVDVVYRQSHPSLGSTLAWTVSAAEVDGPREPSPVPVDAAGYRLFLSDALYVALVELAERAGADHWTGIVVDVAADLPVPPPPARSQSPARDDSPRQRPPVLETVREGLRLAVSGPAPRHTLRSQAAPVRTLSAWVVAAPWSDAPPLGPTVFAETRDLA